MAVDRNETDTERLDRNWASLLQELRVVQTGVQLLTGFLLVLPFQDRFGDLNATMKAIYLATVACSVVATILLVAPVGMHRLLFRQHRLPTLVSSAHRFAIAGLLLLGCSLTGVVTLVFYEVTGAIGATIAGSVALVTFTIVWLAVPWLSRP